MYTDIKKERGGKMEKKGLVESILEGASTAEHEMRLLESPGDYDKGLCGVLGELSECGTAREAFVAAAEEMARAGCYYVVVCHERRGDAVAGAGTVFVERKFLHGSRPVGHIEDVVVSRGARGRGVGRAVVGALAAIARALGCYKVILNCSENNAPFYARCGFERRECEMALYF